MGREIVAVIYATVQSYFVDYGCRVPVMDTVLILKSVTDPHALPSSNFTIIRILESDSSTLIRNITSNDDYKWKSEEDSLGVIQWYYTVQ
jgi:hypothetical protein